MVVVALLSLLAHSTLVGNAILAKIAPAPTGPLEGNRYMALFFSVTLGLAVNVLALILLGLCSWFTPTKIVLASISLLIPSLAILNTHRKTLSLLINEWTWADIALISLLLISVILQSLHSTGHWDDTMYHLPLARSYIEQESFQASEFLRFPYFPQNGNVLLSLGLLIAGDTGAQAFATLPLMVICLGLLGTSLLSTGSLITGLIATYFLYRLGPVKSTLGYAYIDNLLAMFCFACILALKYDRSKTELYWPLIIGFLAGTAAGTKFFGGAFAALFAISILLYYRNIRALTLYCLATLVTGCWWYARSWIITGDPIHPFGGELFGYYLWDSGDIQLQASEQAKHGVAPSSLNLLAALDEAKAKFFALAILTLFIPAAKKQLGGMRLIFISYLLLWFFTTQVNRYLAPVYGIGAFLAAWFLYWALWRGPIKRFFTTKNQRVATGMSLLITFLCFESIYSRAVDKMAYTNQARLEQLTSLPGYNLFTRAGKLAPGQQSRLVQLGFDNAVYFFGGEVVGDWFGAGRYRQFLKCPQPSCSLIPPDEMAKKLAGYHANHLILPKSGFPHWDRTAYLGQFSVVDEDEFGYLLTPREFKQP